MEELTLGWPGISIPEDLQEVAIKGEVLLFLVSLHLNSDKQMDGYIDNFKDVERGMGVVPHGLVFQKPPVFSYPTTSIQGIMRKRETILWVADICVKMPVDNLQS